MVISRGACRERIVSSDCRADCERRRAVELRNTPHARVAGRPPRQRDNGPPTNADPADVRAGALTRHAPRLERRRARRADPDTRTPRFAAAETAARRPLPSSRAWDARQRGRGEKHLPPSAIDCRSRPRHPCCRCRHRCLHAQASARARHRRHRRCRCPRPSPRRRLPTPRRCRRPRRRHQQTPQRPRALARARRVAASAARPAPAGRRGRR